MSDFNTSLLVNRQLPEFIREEYPKFISFLEAYYEFLETKQGIQKNNLTEVSKNLRDISDIDKSLDEFETRFYEKFAPLLPKDAAIRKDILFKNLTDLYLAKGNVGSYKLLFRLLFGEEVEIIEPRNEVLKPSASTWLIENALRADPENLYTLYYGNGSKKEFVLAGCRCPRTLTTLLIQVRSVTVNGVETTDYLINRESRKLIFNTAPNNNAVIRVYYDNFDFNLIVNRKVTGKTSRASAIVERTAVSIVSNRRIQDFYINQKTLNGTFDNGEYCVTDIVDKDGNIIVIEFLTTSSLRSINVVEGGSNYSNGDIVVISGGGAEEEAVAVIDEVFSGFIDTIVVNKPGAGFAVGGIIDSIDPPLVVNGSISVVNTSQSNVINTYTIFSDVLISNLTSTSLTMGDTNWNIPNKVINLSSKIYDMSNTRTLTVGQIETCIVLTSNNVVTSVPVVETEGAFFVTGTQKHTITSFGSLGGYEIVSTGQNYKLGDEVVFGPNPIATYGVGAAARVTSVDPLTGGIKRIEFEPTRIGGYANVFSNNHIVYGIDTNFQTELEVGDRIIVNGESRFINAITSDTELNCNVAFTYTTANANMKVGVYNRYLTGGIMYTQNNFPSITISSRNGTGADIRLNSLMGDGENLTARSAKLPGSIVRIRIIDGGRGYKYIPYINLTGTGDGLATASAEIESSFVTFDGKWTSSESILSSTERKIQGRDYYVDYSYVTSSRVEFRKYKKIVKELLHPSGLVNYARLRIDTSANVDSFDVVTLEPRKVMSGTVNIGEGSIYITGNNTKFLSAYSTGTIRIGDALDVNGRIYVVDSIISDTNVRVSQIPSTYGEGAFNTSPRLIYSVPFNETANLQPFNIVGTIMGYANQAFITTRTGRITIEQDGTTAIATENQIEITTE